MPILKKKIFSCPAFPTMIGTSITSRFRAGSFAKKINWTPPKNLLFTPQWVRHSAIPTGILLI